MGLRRGPGEGERGGLTHAPQERRVGFTHAPHPRQYKAQAERVRGAPAMTRTEGRTGKDSGRGSHWQGLGPRAAQAIRGNTLRVRISARHAGKDSDCPGSQLETLDNRSGPGPAGRTQSRQCGHTQSRRAAGAKAHSPLALGGGSSAGRRRPPCTRFDHTVVKLSHAWCRGGLRPTGAARRGTRLSHRGTTPPPHGGHAAHRAYSHGGSLVADRVAHLVGAVAQRRAA